jgi:hypothetical protein
LSDRKDAGFLLCVVMGLFLVAFVAQALKGFLDASAYVTFRLAKADNESNILATKIKLQVHQTVTTVKSLTFLKCPIFLVAMLHLLVRAIAAINVSLSPIGFPSNSSSA